jgi:PAS domain S-box-containing protein
MKEAFETPAPASTSPPKTASGPNSRLQALVQKIETYQQEIVEHRQKLQEVRGQLRDSYSRYTELYELAPVGFLTLDRKGCICEVNEKGARLLGFSAGWLFGRPFVVFVAKEDVRGFLNLLMRSARTLRHEAIELALHVDGRQLPVQLSMRSSNAGASITHRLTVVDLTDVKRTENQLKESLDNWHSLVYNVPDVIMTVERDGKIVFANRSVWNSPIRKLIGSRIIDYIPENERLTFRQCLDKVFSSGERTSCEISGINGVAESWFDFNFGPSQNDGRADGKKSTTVMIREITQHKHAEENLRSSGEQLREFAARLEAVREEERARVAREIHDELGQALTLLKLELSWLENKTPRQQREARKKMKSMMRHVDDTIDRMRRIVSELRPSVLDDLGLIPAIEWQITEFQKRSGIRCRLRSNVEEVDLDPERSAAIFRVVQEALTNVMRHAKAKSVQIHFRKDQDLLNISVVDDGRGLNGDSINDLGSLGIVGMRERIARVGGEFEINSQPGRGTRLDIIIPTQP